MKSLLKNLLKWGLLAISNVLMIVIAVIVSATYTHRVTEAQGQARLKSFITSMESMEQFCAYYLTSERNYILSSVAFIEESDLSLEKAMAYLRNSDTIQDRYNHLIDTTTYCGYTNEALHGQGFSGTLEDYRIDDYRTYMLGNSAYGDSTEFIETFNKMCVSGKDEVLVLGQYKYGEGNKTCIAVGEKVSIRDDNGDGYRNYLLLRVIPVVILRENWTFPTEYSTVSIGLITKKGGYAFQSDAMRSTSFVEYIRGYNFPDDYPQMYALEEKLATTDSGLLEYKDYRSRDCYWYYTELTCTENLFILGSIPKASLAPDEVSWFNVIATSVLFILLILVNGSYILVINKKLRVSAKMANSANVAKTRFLSSMSHDIRTPMNAIIGMTTIAEKHITEPGVVSDCLNKISLAGNHLLTLINDILDISKVESGKMTLNSNVFSLEEVASNLANIVRPQVRAKDLQFEIHTHNIEHEYLFADELRINQIFINLLTNAVKYTPEGGTVTLDIMQEVIPDDKNSAMITYIVKDTGIGMSKEFTDVMYEAFTRAKDSRTDKIQGSGMGLAITKQLVDLMNGVIECESELGKGTKFTVKICVALADKLTDDLMLPPIDILVADDDTIFLATAEDLLRDMGTTPEVVNTGTDAVNKVIERKNSGQRQYPVIILDWKMPDLDGIEATRRIREVVGEDVSIIVISAYDWSDMEEIAVSAGANGFISKPFFRSSVYKTINGLISEGSETKQPENVDEKCFNGKHFLIAEDNDLNWEIIQALLEDYGVVCDRAINGQVCVEMITSAPEGFYDIILMDIQMPVMNGKAATMEIRKHSSQYVSNIPIIAMTADAFAEDIRECLSIGMNAHVAKPIEINKLLQTLKKFLS